MTIRNIAGTLSLTLIALIISTTQLQASTALSGIQSDPTSSPERKDYRYAISLYDYGMYEKASEIFADISTIEAQGYYVLCNAKMQTPGYEALISSYIKQYPYASLVPQIRFAYAGNLFAAGNYIAASEQYELLSRSRLYRRQSPEFLFNRAYCDFETGDFDRAKTRFNEVIYHTNSAAYVLPSHYFIGYIYYSEQNFTEAERHFKLSTGDARFSEISNYYILECRFMDKDYQYVVANGPSMMESIPQDRQRQLSRLISESYLVLGNASEARSYYDKEEFTSEGKSDEDLFYAGSVLFAVGDWAGAADNFSKIEEKTDSIGQIANYELASCQLNLKNKVAALDAFKYASQSDVNQEIKEDAFYNYAKLAFDLNGDISVFENYLTVYSDRKRGDQVWSYIAVGALKNRDYAGAVEAYDKIDELDESMRSNYMKANFLRAKQLIDDGSWRAAVPCLKAAAYYSDRREGFNQLSRYWLAEAYYRDGKYDDSLSGFRELYNTAALYGTTESNLLTYNIGYCYFAKEDYESAATWFGDYTKAGDKTVRKEALIREGDSWFYQKDYASALPAYLSAVTDYPDVNDIYPYYYAALCYGLSDNNAQKIKILEEVRGAKPTAAYYPEALCELGVTYSRTGDDTKAGECFTSLISNTKDSTYISRALIELGTLAMKNSDRDKAISYYKRVIETMPQSHYTDDALLALESVYRAENDPQTYLAYLDSIGKSSTKTPEEREDMIFSSAEQVYLAGNFAKALSALNSYLETYPSGTRKAEAEFYIAECYRQTGQNETALDRYASVMTYGTGSFLELSTLRYSELSYKLQKYSDAYTGYGKLLATAQIDENRHTARVGMMRSAYNARLYDKAVSAADDLMAANAVNSSKLDASTISAENTEAAYVKGKSYLAMSNRDAAIPLFTQLAKTPSTDYGGEASYLLILDSYNRGEFKDVEDKVFAFSDAQNPQQYWLAKSFVVLGDSYAEQGDFEQAKATFESVRDGYNPSTPDDVKDNLDLRISKAAEMINNRNN
ncbi:MAG: tetratricopeptide repeat protein [Bacteroidales bacterium]|nr:tetratricopeptide repeat protein [Bacteroidales bacterium]